LKYLFFSLELLMASGNIDENEIIERDTINKCMQALKTPNGNWNYEPNTWDEVSYFFRNWEDKHNGILSNNAHFKLFVSWCIEDIKRAPDQASSSFELLGKATKTVAMETTDIASELGELVASTNDDLPQQVKDEAKEFLKNLEATAKILKPSIDAHVGGF